MYVCMYVCMYVYICMYMYCIYISISTHTHTHTLYSNLILIFFVYAAGPLIYAKFAQESQDNLHLMQVHYSYMYIYTYIVCMYICRYILVCVCVIPTALEVLWELTLAIALTKVHSTN